MKRSSLRRKTPLARKPMRRGKRRTKYARRERDRPRIQWTWQQNCAVADWGYGRVASWHGPPAGRCSGRVEAHHAGVHGYGNKAPDDTVIPMCTLHHGQITGEPGGRGCFDAWPRGTVKEWELVMIEHYRARYAAHLSGMEAIAL